MISRRIRSRFSPPTIRLWPCFAIAAGAIAATRLNEPRLREAAGDEALLATEAAHYLVRRGMPFRQAHEIVGQMVREAERAGESWATLPLARLQTFSPLFDADLPAGADSLGAALETRDVPEVLRPARVREALEDYRRRLKDAAPWEGRT